MKNNLTGSRYIMDVGVLKTELYFETDESMVFTVMEGGSLTKNGYSESVETTIAAGIHGGMERNFRGNGNACRRP